MTFIMVEKFNLEILLRDTWTAIQQKESFKNWSQRKHNFNYWDKRLEC